MFLFMMLLLNLHLTELGIGHVHCLDIEHVSHSNVEEVVHGFKVSLTIKEHLSDGGVQEKPLQHLVHHLHQIEVLVQLHLVDIENVYYFIGPNLKETNISVLP